jgi:outer membrane lipoprotein SlyB
MSDQRGTKGLVIAILASAMLSACTGMHGAGTYSRGQAGELQEVKRGQIVAMRDVEVEGTDSGAGKIGGGVLGGVGGSKIGKGSRAGIAGAVGGAIAGAILGTVLENQLTKTTATEITIRLENGPLVSPVQKNDEQLQIGERVLVMEANRRTGLFRGGKSRVVCDTMPVGATSFVVPQSTPAPQTTDWTRPPASAPMPVVPSPEIRDDSTKVK